MTQELFGIIFAAFEYVYTLPFLVAILGVAWYCYHKRATIINRLVRPERRAFFLPGYSQARARIKLFLTFISFMLLFLALLRPQWNEKEQTFQQEGRDVYIILDVSRSMLAQDVKPDRLSFAKQKIRTLVKTLKTDRVGLILFSGSAFVYCPLTNDIAAFEMFLNQVDAQTISSGTTAIDQALEKVIRTIESGPKRKSNLVVIFTDGEDYSTGLSFIKQKARELAMTIFTIGVGTPAGAPIPIVDAQGKQIGHQKDKHGSVVISKLHEEVIATLAQDLGGQYIRATTGDDADIMQLRKEVDRFEKEQFDEKKQMGYEEQFYWFVVPAVCLLILEWLL